MTLKKAFTLVELMVAISILSIGLVVMLQGMAHSLNVLQISEDNLRASLAVENEMAGAFILAKGNWEALENGVNEKFDFLGLECEWTVSLNLEKIEREIPEETTFALEPEEELELYKMDAALSWEEGKRRGRIPLVLYMIKPPEEKEAMSSAGKEQ